MILVTCREKIALERPDCISSECIGGVESCPNDYGYMEKPRYCDLGSTSELCTKCWDREIPGTEKLSTSKEPHILDSGNRREFESGATEKKITMKHYFIVYLSDGSIMDFGNKCNHVSFFDEEERFFQFKNETSDGYFVLAIIPVEYILRIVSEEECL